MAEVPALAGTTKHRTKTRLPVFIQRVNFVPEKTIRQGAGRGRAEAREWRIQSAERGMGAAVLLGISLHIVWLMAPSFGVQTLLPAVLGIVLLGALFAMFLRRTGLRWAAQRNEAAAHHG